MRHYVQRGLKIGGLCYVLLTLLQVDCRVSYKLIAVIYHIDRLAEPEKQKAPNQCIRWLGAF